MDVVGTNIHDDSLVCQDDLIVKCNVALDGDLTRCLDGCKAALEILLGELAEYGEPFTARSCIAR